jgi:hypothetical protein
MRSLFQLFLMCKLGFDLTTHKLHSGGATTRLVGSFLMRARRKLTPIHTAPRCQQSIAQYWLGTNFSVGAKICLKNCSQGATIVS